LTYSAYIIPAKRRSSLTGIFSSEIARSEEGDTIANGKRYLRDQEFVYCYGIREAP